MIAFGELALWMALLMACWSSVVSRLRVTGVRGALAVSGVRALWAAAVFTGLAVLALEWAFATHAYELRYVALHSSDRVGLGFALSALWAAPEGTVLLGALFFAGAAALEARAGAGRTDFSAANTTAAGAPVLACALAWIAFAGRLFTRLDVLPANGRGLAPPLQDWARALDTPLLALGCAALLAWFVVVLSALTVLGRTTRVPWRDVGGRWPHLAVALLMAGTGLRLWWTYARGGAVPSPSAIAGSPAIATSATLCLAAATAAWFVRRPNRATGRLGAAGSGLLAIGLAASWFGREYDASTGDGDTFRARDAWGAEWSFTSQGVSRVERPAYLLTSVALLPARAGIRQPLMTAGLREYFDDLDLGREVPDARPGIRHLLSQDVRVQAVALDTEHGALRIRFSPLISLVWIGVSLLVVAELAALGAPAVRRVR